MFCRHIFPCFLQERNLRTASSWERICLSLSKSSHSSENWDIIPSNIRLRIGEMPLSVRTAWKICRYSMPLYLSLKDISWIHAIHNNFLQNVLLKNYPQSTWKKNQQFCKLQLGWFQSWRNPFFWCGNKILMGYAFFVNLFKNKSKFGLLLFSVLFILSFSLPEGQST